MPEPKADMLVRSVQTLVVERRAVAAKEKRLVLRLGARPACGLCYAPELRSGCVATALQ